MNAKNYSFIKCESFPGAVFWDITRETHLRYLIFLMRLKSPTLKKVAIVECKTLDNGNHVWQCLTIVFNTNKEGPSHLLHSWPRSSAPGKKYLKDHALIFFFYWIASIVLVTSASSAALSFILLQTMSPHSPTGPQALTMKAWSSDLRTADVRVIHSQREPGCPGCRPMSPTCTTQATHLHLLTQL